MPWHIEDSVIRGELENCQRGRVRGRLWLTGWPGPVALELRGNACPDLAGCWCFFQNPHPARPLPQGLRLDPVQQGHAGDFTASRRLRRHDRHFGCGGWISKAAPTGQEYTENGLYFEWYSAANGRVVIESAAFEVRVSTPAWRPTAEEEELRRREAAASFASFISELDLALEAARHDPPPEKEWDEFDYEKFLRKNDRRAAKYAELLDKYQDHPDRDRVVAREMGWTHIEEWLDRKGHPADAETGIDEEDDPIGFLRAMALWHPEEDPAPPAPAGQQEDWILDEFGHAQHPLALRAANASFALRTHVAGLAIPARDAADVAALTDEYLITSTKLAGVLNGVVGRQGLVDGPFVVACLKRALSHLHATQAALERLAGRAALPASLLDSTRRELFAIREETLRLMDHFRGRKRPGTG